MNDLTLGEAARALGVSVDTLRRWDRSGKLRTVRDARNRRRVPGSEVDRLRPSPAREAPGDGFSARNRFPGVVRSVEVDGVMALVEIEAGPAPRDRGGDAGCRRGSRARPRRRRHRGGEGDVGHGRANSVPESTLTWVTR